MDLLKRIKSFTDEELLEEWFLVKEALKRHGANEFNVKEDVLKSEILKRMSGQKNPF